MLQCVSTAIPSAALSDRHVILYVMRSTRSAMAATTTSLKDDEAAASSAALPTSFRFTTVGHAVLRYSSYVGNIKVKPSESIADIRARPVQEVHGQRECCDATELHTCMLLMA